MRRLIALVLIASGLSLVTVLAGQGVLESHQTAQAQEHLRDELPQGPTATPSDPIPTAVPVAVGKAFVTMSIPRFGKDWRWVALEGTSPAVLVDGPGHYRGTALPGDRGNAAFAAHRAGHGDPFIDFDLLKPGDRITFEQGDTRWVYVLDTKPRIIPISASWVLNRTPGRQLTLTTCWPRYGSSKRMFVRGHLDTSRF